MVKIRSAAIKLLWLLLTNVFNVATSLASLTIWAARFVDTVLKLLTSQALNCDIWFWRLATSFASLLTWVFKLDDKLLAWVLRALISASSTSLATCKDCILFLLITLSACKFDILDLLVVLSVCKDCILFEWVRIIASSATWFDLWYLFEVEMN